MRNYYTFTIIYYNDYSEDDEYKGEEYYEAFIRAKDESSAIKKIINSALKNFKKDFSEKIVITGLDINQFYETTDDAML